MREIFPGSSAPGLVSVAVPVRDKRGGPPAPFPQAFTLIELLVVIAILGILAALVVPVLNRGKESARSARCLSNLHQIGIGLQLYVADNGNRLPTLVDWSAASST